MDETKLLRMDGTAFVKLVSNADAAFKNLQALGRKHEQKLAWRSVRGAKCATKGGLLDEWSAAWQFPPHFGDNWDALNDCLTDLNPLASLGYLTLVTQASLVLSKENSEAMKVMVQLIENVAIYWKKGTPSKPPRLFRVVLQTEVKDEGKMDQIWTRLGHSLERV